MGVSFESEFLEAYQRYADDIFRFCYYRVYDREQAKELTQESYCRAWKYLAAGNAIENLRAFLYTTARHVIIDYHRKKKETSLEELQAQGFEPAAPPGDRAAIVADAHQAFSVLRQLDEPYRDVLILRFVDGLTPREIAKVTGETANVISVRIHRGLAKLRLLLNA